MTTRRRPMITSTARKAAKAQHGLQSTTTAKRKSGKASPASKDGGLSETEIQKRVWAVIEFLDLRACHVANQGKRSVQWAVTLRKMGVVSGVPDLLIFDRIGEACGLAIELKSASGRASPAQLDWIEALKGRGWIAVVRSGLHSALAEVIRHYAPTTWWGLWCEPGCTMNHDGAR